MSGVNQKSEIQTTLKSVLATPSLDTFNMMKALAPAILGNCANQNKAFLQCKRDKGEDPELCLEQAIDCRNCMINTASSFMDPKNGCVNVFVPYLTCMYRTRGDYTKCHDERSAFEACAAENIGIEFMQPVKPYTDMSDL